jgi:hypothetical protein
MGKWTKAQHAKYKATMALKREARHASRIKKGSRKPATQAHIAYAFGYTDAWLSLYAKSVGIPQALLTSRVADLLHSQASREVLGA